jgi:alpha-L-fucosidase
MRQHALSKLSRGETRRKVSAYLHTLVTWYHPENNAKGNMEWFEKQQEFDEFLRGPGLADDKLDAKWSQAFAKYYDGQWRPHFKKWAKQFRSNVEYSILTLLGRSSPSTARERDGYDQRRDA